jgi:Tfp pilus assembly protein PilV
VRVTNDQPTNRNIATRARRMLSRGFTILEVTMATFVLALGIATSIIAIQSGLKFIDVARDTTLASQILQSEIERIRMMSWSSVSALPSTASVNLSDMFSSSATLARRFTVTRTVESDSARPADVRLITLSVTWRAVDGRTQTRSFQAKYIRNGLYDYFYTIARSS